MARPERAVEDMAKYSEDFTAAPAVLVPGLATDLTDRPVKVAGASGSSKTYQAAGL